MCVFVCVCVFWVSLHVCMCVCVCVWGDEGLACSGWGKVVPVSVISRTITFMRWVGMYISVWGLASEPTGVYSIRKCFSVACMNPRLAYWMYDYLYIIAFGCNSCQNVCIVPPANNTMPTSCGCLYTVVCVIIYVHIGIIVPTANNMMPTCTVVRVDVLMWNSYFIQKKTFPCEKSSCWGGERC